MRVIPSRISVCFLVFLLGTVLLSSCRQTDGGSLPTLLSPTPRITDLIATLSAPEDFTPTPFELPVETAVPTTISISQEDTPEPPVSPVQEPTAQPVESPTVPTPLETPEPRPTPTMEISFQDNFDMAMGWYTFESDRYRMEFKGGGYHIYNNMLNTAVNSIRTKNFSDVYLEVDAVRVSGAPNAYYGLVCRFQDDGHYYALVLGSDGFYGIARSSGSSPEFITRPPSPNDAIKGGFNVNRIGASCYGDKLALYANGVKLVEVTDKSFTSGFIGLVVGTTSVEGVEVNFDNFTVYKLEE
jgi:hypothetical protein